MVFDSSRPAPIPSYLAPLLTPLCWAYAGVARVRAALYASGRYRTRWLRGPVISVGNLTAGGSGKTPVVEYLARQLLTRGVRMAVLTRGYGRRGLSGLIRVNGVEAMTASPDSLGDEPFWLAMRNPELMVCIGASRYEAGRLGELDGLARAFLLDDGFQHLALGRQLNLLLVDAGRGLGNARVLPCGWLREPVSAARRADAIIVTQANLGDAAQVLAPLRARLGALPPVFRFDYRASRLTRLDGMAELPPDRLSGQGVRALCAIARPEAFAATLRGLGAQVLRLDARPDHDPYDDAALAALDRDLEIAPADAPTALTTEKDAVKLRGRLKHADRLWVLEMEVEPDPAWKDFFTRFLNAHGLGGSSGT